MATKSFGLPLQAIRDTDGNKHPWYMSGSVSIDETGHIQTSTHLESHIALSGFTGGMVATFLNAEGHVLGATPALKYGVDGFALPRWLGASPSPRTATAEFDVGENMYGQTDKIAISLFHVPQSRVNRDIAIAAKLLVEVITLIEKAFGGTSGTVLTKASDVLDVVATKRLAAVDPAPARRPGS